MTRKSSKTNEYDLAVLGGGSAGYAAARTAAAGGLRTVVIEGGAEVGGLCILRGCMPSKALLYAAETLHQSRRAETWGLRIPKAGFDFAAVMARKMAMIKDFADYRRQQLEAGTFAFLRAEARMLDRHQIEVVDSSGRRTFLRVKNIVVSTGSCSAPPPCPGLAEAGFLTSDDALSLEKLPRSLIILGGGSVAVELAQYFCRMDVKVTLIQRSSHLLRELDPDAATTLETVLRREGITLFAPTRLTRAFREGRNKVVEFEHVNEARRAEASAVLAATGRIPNTAGLGLEEIGVRTEQGRIVTDAQMQTSVPNIYAAGDCTGPHPLVHLAVEQGEIAATTFCIRGKSAAWITGFSRGLFSPTRRSPPWA